MKTRHLIKVSLLFVLVLITVSSCSKPVTNCLPYAGKVVAKIPCGGTLIQVTNQDINTTYNDGRQAFTNVLGGLVFDGVVDTSIVQLNKTIYFDIRELKPEENLPCQAIFAVPSRRVGITRISDQPCLINNP